MVASFLLARTSNEVTATNGQEDKMRITKLDNGLFGVSTGKLYGDAQCELVNGELKTKWQKGLIQAPIRVKLSASALDRISSLKSGASAIEFTKPGTKHNPLISEVK